LLSEGAEVDTKPQLEIYADDVKCSHGATVGQLDENQIFYLRSRGVDGRSGKETVDSCLRRGDHQPLRHSAAARSAAGLLADRLTMLGSWGVA